MDLEKVEKLKNIKDAVEINRDRLRFLLFCNGIENWEKYKFTNQMKILLQKKCIEIWKTGCFRK